MEAIHCFYDNVADLSIDAANAIAAQCFARFTKNMLRRLKPKKMIFLGNQPYKVFRPYLEREIDNYEYCALTLDGVSIPVLRHPAPAGFNAGGFYRIGACANFNLYCNDFDLGRKRGSELMCLKSLDKFQFVRRDEKML